MPRLVERAGCAVWSPFFRELTAERVREAGALGLAVIPWTVNDRADMARLIDARRATGSSPTTPTASAR